MINKNNSKSITLIIALVTFSFCAIAQKKISLDTVNNQTEAYKQIQKRSAVWTEAYNQRDSIQFYGLFDSSAVVASAGGKWIGLEQCKDICRGLYRRRPDILWNNQPTKIEVNEQWQVAYETGDWTESWTQKGDTSRSEIKGKYWIMWGFNDKDWHILSATYTPLSCKGSYCK